MSHIVVEGMDLKNILTLMKINPGNYSIVQVKVDVHSKAANKAIKDLIIPANAALIAISRGKDTIITRGDTIINGGDNILLLADRNAQIKTNKIFGPVE
ncbi:MAG: TrkA C-terminal domain-containing protein [Clostridiaceae bacterium]